MLRCIWVLVLLLFPITTFPWLPGDTVRPASFLPAALLLLVIPLKPARLRVLAGSEVYLLAFFAAHAAFSGLTLLALWSNSNLEAYTNVNPLTDFLRGWVSLLTGIIFYVAFRVAHQNPSQLRLTERVLLGSIALSVWLAVLQWSSIALPGLRTGVLGITHLFVDTSIDWVGRYHGLAYEPSWLASQLTVVALPLLLARLLSGSSLSPIPLIGIPLELGLLGLILLGVLLTDSRTALFAAMVITITAIVAAIGKRGFVPSLILLTIVLGAIFPLATQSAWVGNTVRALNTSSSPIEFAIQAAAGPRVSAWIAGWYTFLKNPISGVGLGNSYRFYPDHVPSWSVSEPEVQMWLHTAGEVKPNPKNLPIKLLSETGIIGFILYFSFVLLHYRFRPRSKYLRILYSTSLVALIINYFSLDTFALPTEWFLLGFVMLYGRYQEGSQ